MSRAGLRVDPADPTPPYEQLRRQFVALLETGVLAPGERLPPLRQLAADLGLAVGTVARTYRELEAAGLVRSRRGGGTRVADDVPAAPPEPDPPRRAAAASRLDAAVAAVVHAAEEAGLEDDLVLARVRAALAAARRTG